MFVGTLCCDPLCSHTSESNLYTPKGPCLYANPWNCLKFAYWESRVEPVLVSPPWSRCLSTQTPASVPSSPGTSVQVRPYREGLRWGQSLRGWPLRFPTRFNLSSYLSTSSEGAVEHPQEREQGEKVTPSKTKQLTKEKEKEKRKSTPYSKVLKATTSKNLKKNKNQVGTQRYSSQCSHSG